MPLAELPALRASTVAARRIALVHASRWEATNPVKKTL